MRSHSAVYSGLLLTLAAGCSSSAADTTEGGASPVSDAATSNAADGGSSFERDGSSRRDANADALPLLDASPSSSDAPIGPTPDAMSRPPDASTPETSTPASPEGGPVVKGAINLGMNVSALAYYNNSAMYADVALQMGGNQGPWDTPFPGDTLATLDATGAPTSAAWTAWTGDYPSGVYTLTWDGTGTISFGSGATVGAVQTTTSGGVTHNTVAVTVTQNLTPPNGAAPPNFNIVNVTAPVTNIHMMAPESLRAAGGLFLQNFIDKLRPFTTLRFMDALNTNNNDTTQDWSQRTWPSGGSRASTAQGMAYEDIVALANATGKNIWINIPAWATDDYVCRLARLLRYGEPGDATNSACSLTAPSSAPAGAVALNAGSLVYVEYSNEVWNWAFQQTPDLYCMANGAPAPGHTCTATQPTSAIAQAALADASVPWDTGNLWYRGTEMGLILAKRNHDVFKTIFGAHASQIHVVFNVQAAWAAEVDPGFLFMKAAYGSVSSIIDEMAVAPYFGLPSDTSDTGAGCYDCSVDSIFSTFTATVLDASATGDTSSIANWLEGDLAEANTYGLSLIAYEGGEGLSGTNADLVTAQFDPRMYTATQQYMQLWSQLVGPDHLFNYFSMAGSYGTWGAWGALLNLSDTGSQKWDALMPLTRPLGDANLDGLVNGLDCAILQASFGKTGQWWADGDFNHDGSVDTADLAIMNQNISGAACTQ